MIITIEQVQKNDVILEQGGKKKTEVKKVVHSACSSFGTHINDRFCYERGSEVSVERGAKVEEVTDDDLDAMLDAKFEIGDEAYLRQQQASLSYVTH